MYIYNISLKSQYDTYHYVCKLETFTELYDSKVKHNGKYDLKKILFPVQFSCCKLLQLEKKGNRYAAEKDNFLPLNMSVTLTIFWYKYTHIYKCIM